MIPSLPTLIFVGTLLAELEILNRASDGSSIGCFLDCREVNLEQAIPGAALSMAEIYAGTRFA